MENIQKVIKQFKLPILSIDTVPESFSSEVYKIQLINKKNVYIKIPFSKDKLFREYKMLIKLKNYMSVPTVLDYWEGDETVTGALLLEEIIGVPCLGRIDFQLAFQIGVNHAMLHALSMPVYGAETENGFKPLENNDWRNFIQQTFIKFEKHTRLELPNDLYEKSIRHFELIFPTLPAPDGPCIIHMDFRPGNILIHDNKVSGIIDFESARVGSTEIDFAKINRDVWCKYEGTRDAYISGYESIRPILNLDSILSFYSFYDAFNSIGWCRLRGVDKHQAFLNENIEILRKIL
ncbi:phosphotransferase [Bacillus sp. FJAT-22090]|uniref:phosphotransferase family protein n=1 Tax=Bacillus sp. FJAT-22090 TaxID=1581038 RepID=UPI0006AE8EF4|nr:phosphotransferase [Bacillus sp. FJAT-22090]ALC85105.1 phosphotransferase [Bacillus sp. FJAT-22090]